MKNWVTKYSFKVEFGEYFSLVDGDNYSKHIKYYKGNDAKRVIEDAKKELKKKGWVWAEITDNKNKELGIIKENGFFHAYDYGEEFWGVKSDNEYKDGGNIPKFEYTVGGL